MKQKPGNQNVAVFCAGNNEYFSQPSSPPYVALDSFRDQFADELDYFCCGDLGNNSLDLIKFHNFMPLKCKVELDGGRDALRRWPVECFTSLLLPQQFLDMGYEYTISIDGDVYCNKAFQISDILPEDECVSVAHHPGLDGINTGVVVFNNRLYCETATSDVLIKAVAACKPESDQHLLQYLLNTDAVTYKLMPYWYNFCLRALEIQSYVTELQKIKDHGSANADIIKKIHVAHFVRGKPWVEEINKKAHWNYEIRNFFVKRFLLKQSELIARSPR